MLYTPWALLLLMLLPVVAYVGFKRLRGASVRFSSVGHFAGCPGSLRQRLRPVLIVLRLGCIGLVIYALARPREGTRIEKISTEGVAMMITVDRSSSMGEPMRYKGEQLNRLEVVKRVAGDFIKGDGADYKGRLGDMIGLVTYARYADTQCPLVRGGGIISDFLGQTQLVTQRSEDGTAIGDGIALAAARLQKAEQQIVDQQGSDTRRMRTLRSKAR
jgi:Ca-activated chloride channel homolog